MVGTSRYLQFRSLKWPLTRGEIIQIQMAPATDPSRTFLLKEVHGAFHTSARTRLVRRCSFWGPQSLGETEPRFKRISRISDFKTKKWGFFHGDNKKNWDTALTNAPCVSLDQRAKCHREFVEARWCHCVKPRPYRWSHWRATRK